VAGLMFPMMVVSHLLAPNIFRLHFEHGDPAE
jgi:hypothetical protein